MYFENVTVVDPDLACLLNTQMFYIGPGYIRSELLVRLVPMLEQQNRVRKGICFKLGSEQPCHRLGSETKRDIQHKPDIKPVIR